MISNYYVLVALNVLFTNTNLIEFFYHSFIIHKNVFFKSHSIHYNFQTNNLSKWSKRKCNDYYTSQYRNDYEIL